VVITASRAIFLMPVLLNPTVPPDSDGWAPLFCQVDIPRVVELNLGKILPFYMLLL
jgi:hypothetical protein